MQGFVKGHGLEYLPIGPCISSIQFGKAVANSANYSNFTRAWAAYQANRDLYNSPDKPSPALSWLRAITKGCRDIQPDLLLLVFTSYSGAAIIPAMLGLHTRVVLSYPIPMATTSRFCFTMAGTGFSLWPCMNKVQWDSTQRTVVQSICFKGAQRNLKIICDEAVAAGTPFPKAGTVKLDKDLNTKGLPRLFAYSPALLAKPADWPAHYHVLGQMGMKKLGTDTAKELPIALKKCLDDCKSKGFAVVYVGLSVLSFFSQEKVTHILDAVAAAVSKVAAVRPVRAVIQTTLSSVPGKVGEMSSAAIIKSDKGVTEEQVVVPYFTFSDTVDHSVLFPQTSLVICHGGIGTVATALAAGRPVLSIACVPTVDQSFWADLCYRKKLGPNWIWVNKLTAKGLAARITDAIDNLDLYTHNAGALAKQMAKEEGVEIAMELLEKEAIEAQKGSLVEVSGYEAYIDHLLEPSRTQI